MILGAETNLTIPVYQGYHHYSPALIGKLAEKGLGIISIRRGLEDIFAKMMVNPDGGHVYIQEGCEVSPNAIFLGKGDVLIRNSSGGEKTVIEDGVIICTDRESTLKGIAPPVIEGFPKEKGYQENVYPITFIGTHVKKGAIIYDCAFVNTTVEEDSFLQNAKVDYRSSLSRVKKGEKIVGGYSEQGRYNEYTGEGDYHKRFPGSWPEVVKGEKEFFKKYGKNIEAAKKANAEKAARQAKRKTPKRPEAHFTPRRKAGTGPIKE